MRSLPPAPSMTSAPVEPTMTSSPGVPVIVPAPVMVADRWKQLGAALAVL